MSALEHLLFTKKIHDELVELGALLHLGPVATLVKDVELHSWGFHGGVVGVLYRNDLVLGIPHNQH